MVMEKRERGYTKKIRSKQILILNLNQKILFDNFERLLKSKLNRKINFVREICVSTT